MKNELNENINLNFLEGIVVAISLSIGIGTVLAILDTANVEWEYIVLFGNVFGSIIGLFLLFTFLKWRNKDRTIWIHFKTKTSWISYILGILLTLVVSALLINFGFWKVNTSTHNLSTIAHIDGIWAFTIVPIIEEIVFRRFLQIGWENKYGSFVSVILVALIFGFLHTTIGIPIVQLIGGLIYALVFYRTRDLMLCIFMHSIHNFIAYLNETHAFHSLFQNILELDTVTIMPLLLIGCILTAYFLNIINYDKIYEPKG